MTRTGESPEVLEARKEALKEAMAIVRAVYDETPGSAVDVYIKTMDELNKALAYLNGRST